MKTKKQENKALRKLAKEALKASTSEVCQTWKDKILEAVPSLEVKPDLVVGKWYKINRGGNNALIYYTNSYNDYGFNYGNNWTNSFSTKNAVLHNRMFKPATDKEVEQALIAEAKKRYKENDFIESVYDNSFRGHIIIESVFIENNQVWVNSKNKNEITIQLFEKGQWAEIIPNTITKAEAEQKLGLTIID